jgi:hypothetical protein
MKRLIDLRKGDFLYDINSRKLEIIGLSLSDKEKQIMSVHIKNHYDRWQDVKEPNNTSERFCMTGGYLSYELLFTSEYEAKKERKVVLMRQLEELKEKAHKAIDAVKKYRETHYEELNITLVDRELELLKRIA